MLAADSEYLQLPGELCCSPLGWCHPVGTITVPLKGCSTILSSYFRMMGDMVGPESVCVSLLLYFFLLLSEFPGSKQYCAEYHDCRLGLLSVHGWIIMMVDKASVSPRMEYHDSG